MNILFKNKQGRLCYYNTNTTDVSYAPLRVLKSKSNQYYLYNNETKQLNKIDNSIPGIPTCKNVLAVNGITL